MTCTACKLPLDEDGRQLFEDDGSDTFRRVSAGCGVCKEAMIEEGMCEDCVYDELDGRECRLCDKAFHKACRETGECESMICEHTGPYCSDCRPLTPCVLAALPYESGPMCRGTGWGFCSWCQDSEGWMQVEAKKGLHEAGMACGNCYGKLPDEPAEPAPAPAKKKAKKTMQAPERVPRKPSAYILFCKAERASIVEARPQLTFGEVGKALGAKWKKLSDAEKGKYLEAASEA